MRVLENHQRALCGLVVCHDHGRYGGRETTPKEEKPARGGAIQPRSLLGGAKCPLSPLAFSAPCYYVPLEGGCRQLGFRKDQTGFSPSPVFGASTSSGERVHRPATPQEALGDRLVLAMAMPFCKSGNRRLRIGRRSRRSARKRGPVSADAVSNARPAPKGFHQHRDGSTWPDRATSHSSLQQQDCLVQER
jgi:hypothetical protein